MNQNELKNILADFKAGNIDEDKVLLSLKEKPFTELDYAKIDNHRSLRQGVSEVIYGASKTPEQILGIVESMLEMEEKTIIITRMKEEAFTYLSQKIGYKHKLSYEKLSQMCLVGSKPKADGIGKIVVVTGGTSDMKVAEEAAITAEALGNEVVRLYDCGVAGLHRLLSNLDDLMDATVVIAIAGMEGALASVVGGLVDCPVIGVPTSVGYGASFNGLSALLSMLNSCASGVSVVNIDNGFGAAYQASMINHIKLKK